MRVWVIEELGDDWRPVAAESGWGPNRVYWESLEANALAYAANAERQGRRVRVVSYVRDDEREDEESLTGSDQADVALMLMCAAKIARDGGATLDGLRDALEHAWREMERPS